MAEGETQRFEVRNTNEYLGLRAKYTQLKVAHAALQGQVETLKAEAASAKTEAETAKSKYDGSKLKTENEELRGRLRTTEHRKVFDRLARERGVPDDALDDLWKLSEIQTLKDDVDEVAMGVQLDEQKAKPGRARLFGEPPTEAAPGAPGPARGQGTRDRTNGKVVVTRAQLADGVWSYENSDRLKVASKDGTLEVID